MTLSGELEVIAAVPGDGDEEDGYDGEGGNDGGYGGAYMGDISVVRVGDLRSQSPTVNREKVTKGRQLSNVRDFARCHGVLCTSGLPLGACYIPSLSTAWSSNWFLHHVLYLPLF